MISAHTKTVQVFLSFFLSFVIDSMSVCWYRPVELLKQCHVHFVTWRTKRNDASFVVHWRLKWGKSVLLWEKWRRYDVGTVREFILTFFNANKAWSSLSVLYYGDQGDIWCLWTYSSFLDMVQNDEIGDKATSDESTGATVHHNGKTLSTRRISTNPVAYPSSMCVEKVPGQPL